MIIVVGIGRCGTTYLFNTFYHYAKSKGKIYSGEPFSPWYDQNFRFKIEFHAKLESKFHYTDRFGFWLDEYTLNERSDMTNSALSLYKRHHKKSLGFKTISLAEYKVFRRVFPNCKIIFADRNAAARLNSMNMWDNKSPGAWLTTYKNLSKRMHSVGPSKRIKNYIEKFVSSVCDKKENNKLYYMAMFWEIVNKNWKCSLPNDSLIINYEDIFTNPELEWTRICDYCDIPMLPQKIITPNYNLRRNNVKQGIMHDYDTILDVTEKLESWISKNPKWRIR